MCRSKVTLVDNCFFAVRGPEEDVCFLCLLRGPAFANLKNVMYTRLANLMEWKQRGWLSETEFEAAKVLLLQAPSP